jgi:hypothetical protein
MNEFSWMKVHSHSLFGWCMPEKKEEGEVMHHQRWEEGQSEVWKVLNKNYINVSTIKGGTISDFTRF